MLSTPAFVRVSDMNTRPSSSLMARQYVTVKPPWSGPPGADRTGQ
jgi:hypothetical protein